MRPPGRRRRRPAGVRPIDVALAGAALVALTACAGSAGGAGERLRIEVRDGVLRVAGSECGGGGPFRAVHATAPFEIVDEDGVVVASGELPQGVAERQLEAEVGDLAEPTTCAMELDVPADGGLAGRVVRFDDGREADILEGNGTPTAVIP